MDELADLIAALSRFEERARKPKKRKKVKTTGRPAKMGPSAGCGTGSGGFKAGNNCAKEDGIPQRPLSQGGALKGANAKDDFALAKALKEKAAAKKAKKEADAKAKSIATKPQRDKARVDRKRAAEKQAKIDELRRAAAERKAQKGERDAAERKAAQEAADKKRSEMLQKIRIKKANKKLEIVERPPSIFSGQAANIKKESGETEVAFQIRRHKQDLDKLHSESEKIESSYAKKIEDFKSEREKTMAAASAEDSAAFGNSDIAERLKGVERAKEMRQRAAAIEKQIAASERERNERIHDLVGEFTKSHAGRTANVSADAKDYKIAEGTRDADANDIVRKASEKAWRFYSKVASPDHEEAFKITKIKTRLEAGGSHNMRDNEAIIGNTFKSVDTAVHEYGHAVESRRPATMKALAEDYAARRDKFLVENKGSKILGMERCDYYEGVYASGEFRKDILSKLAEPSHLGYARRYSDFGYDAASRAKYKNDTSGRYEGGTEVFSTGAEALYIEPAAFRRRARHGFDITVLIMAGRL
jgi:hypothetical protein